ncbi:MAG: hypothetical protein A3B68_03190 [Candidatus Melainabacteria bacterium RIFCSPHIGHO2_02_FULL_34_12]|nr:MAG: hypothetical protein A3B68_03190 [Candidatus Melainabacteria bacterium RIFCSPHIGHO2_02_FULL_34_12]
MLDITPNVKLINALRNQKGTLADRLSELIDNSVDAMRNDFVQVDITVRPNDDLIEVIDTGHGIVNIKEALTMGMSEKSHEGTTVGQYGVGMKLSSIYFGDEVEIISRTPDCPTAKRAFISYSKVVASGKWEVDDPKEVNSQIGTTLRIKKLCNLNRLRGGAIQALKNYLSVVYNHKIKSRNLIITLNGENVQPIDLKKCIDEDPSVNVAIDFTVKGSKRVKGWAGMLKNDAKTNPYNQNNLSGFILYYKGRVITSNEKLGYQESKWLSRIVGELHLDDFDITQNKVDFSGREGSEEWEILEQQLEIELKQLIKKVEEKSKSEIPPHLKKDAQSMIKCLEDFLARFDPDTGPHTLYDESRAVAREKRAAKENSLKVVAKHTERKRENASKTSQQKGSVRLRTTPSIKLIFSRGGINSVFSKYSVIKEESTQIIVEINKDHPQYADREISNSLLAFVMCDSVAQYIKSEQNLTDEEYFSIRDGAFRCIPHVIVIGDGRTHGHSPRLAA